MHWVSQNLLRCQLANLGPVVVFRVNVPGAGAVLLDIGRSTNNPETGEHTFIAGPRELLEGDIASLCAALA
jgi:hypothetical protein